MAERPLQLEESSYILANASQHGGTSLPTQQATRGKEPKSFTGLPLSDLAGAASTGEQHIGFIRPQSSFPHQFYTASSAVALQVQAIAHVEQTYLLAQRGMERIAAANLETYSYHGWYHIFQLKQQTNVGEEWTSFMQIFSHTYK